MRFNTKTVHGDANNKGEKGATIFPIYQSTAFRYQTAEEMEDIFNGAKPGFLYSRIGNPSVNEFEKRISLLEGGIGAVACASGMSAWRYQF